MIYSISSSQNEKYKHFKALKLKKERILTEQYTVEGIKSVHDALLANAEIVALLVSEEFYQKTEFEYPENIDLFIIADKLFPALSSTETPSGIIAVIKIKNNSSFVFDLNKPYIYCDNIRDPGNLGTIIRTADASGFGGVILSPDCVDIYNPKTVRSSMGSFFHIPIIENKTYQELSELKKQGFLLFEGILDDDTIDYTVADMTKPLVLVIGNEANGISAEVTNMADVKVKIPIDGKAESLNAAVAAAILMYECRRQRKTLIHE